jgi:hypothetical protein
MRAAYDIERTGLCVVQHPLESGPTKREGTGLSVILVDVGFVQ